MDLVRPVLLQAGVFAALGGALYAMRKLSNDVVHPLVAQYPDLVRRHHGLAVTASRLATLGNAEAFKRVVAALAAVDEADAQGGTTAQWRISRLSAEAVREAKAMCARAPTARSDEAYRAALVCADEVVPQLQGHLDDLLHNHLLARG